MMGIKRFITCLIPVYSCNFECSYCYLKARQKQHKGGIRPFVASPEEIREKLSRKRLGGTCYFNLCAEGETMLHPRIIDLVYQLTMEGHYADIITNGLITSRINELTDRLSEEQKKRVLVKFSFHYLELKKRCLLNQFVDNVRSVQDAGISFSVEITPHDELIPFIDEIKEFSGNAFGAWPHITVARDESSSAMKILTGYTREEYHRIWSAFDSELFDYKFNLFGVKRHEFCHAGLWSLFVKLETGVYAQCYKGDILGNIMNGKESIKLRPIGRCRESHCFNGHAFLALGNIPELATITYANERNRKTATGNWLQSETYDFFSTFLFESNASVPAGERRRILLTGPCMRGLSFIVKMGLFMERRIKELSETKAGNRTSEIN